MSQHRWVVMLADCAAIAIAWFGAGALLSAWQDGVNWEQLALIFLSYLTVSAVYEERSPYFKRDLLKNLRISVQFGILMLFLLVLVLYGFQLRLLFPRKGFWAFEAMFFPLLFAGRVLTSWFFRWYYRNPVRRKRMVIIANPSNGMRLVNRVGLAKMLDCDIAGIVIFDAKEGVKPYYYQMLRRNSPSHGKAFGATYLSEKHHDVMDFLQKYAVDEALISLPDCNGTQIRTILERMEAMGIDSHLTTDTFGFHLEVSSLQVVASCQALTYSPRLFSGRELAIKRLIDILGGLIGCLLCLVIGLFVCAAIYLEDPGPVLFKQKRVRRNGRVFEIYKFRSMYQDAEERKKELMAQNEMNGLMFKMKNDPRITKVGKFIRKTSLDEFPQFFNVLKGEMSLIGTRPPTVAEFEQYSYYHKRRLSLKPGITGLWQVMGRSEITDFDDVVKLDVEYIDNWSIWQDIRILFKTVWVVLAGKGSE